MSNINAKNLRKFICVDYPGLVENENEAIRTLGGYDRIYQAFARKNSKLLVNYTPDNIFSKMICSIQIDEPNSEQENGHLNSSDNNDTANANGSPGFSDVGQDTSGQLSREATPFKNKNNDLILPCLLMSVKKQKYGGELKSEIVGKIRKLYCFTKMADFQYLPMGNVSSKQSSSQSSGETVSALSPKSATQTQFNYTAFYDNFLFSKIDNYQQELKFNNLPQLFILPPFFSRFDDPINYAFRAEPNKKEPVKRSPAKASSQLEKLTPINESSQEGERAENERDSNSEGDMSEDDYESKLDRSGNSSENSVKRTRENSRERDDSSTTLIQSRRQERSSQAVLVTYNCKEVPASKLFEKKK